MFSKRTTLLFLCTIVPFACNRYLFGTGNFKKPVLDYLLEQTLDHHKQIQKRPNRRKIKNIEQYSNISHLFEQAILFHLKKDTESLIYAEFYYNEINEINPHEGTVHNNLGVIYEEWAQNKKYPHPYYKKARRYYITALRLNNPCGYLNYGRMLEYGIGNLPNPIEAKIYYERAIQLFNDSLRNESKQEVRQTRPKGKKESKIE